MSIAAEAEELARVRRVVAGFLEAHQIDGVIDASVLLAVNEACTDVICRRQSTTIDLYAFVDDDMLVMRIRSDVALPPLNGSERIDMFGLQLMQRLADEVVVARDDTATETVLRFSGA